MTQLDLKTIAERDLLLARIWSRTEIPGGRWWKRQCWGWEGALTTDRPDHSGGYGGGYACMRWQDKWLRVHRVVFELLHRALQWDEVVRHACDNRKCINPHHLEAGTLSDNMRDVHERGRAKGKQRAGRHINPAKGNQARKPKGELDPKDIPF